MRPSGTRVFAGIVRGVLDELRVAAPEQRDFLDLLQREFRDQVVEAP